MAPKNMICEITQKSETWKILVRVLRKWDIYLKATPDVLFAISMVLVDEEGSKIQALVKKKELHQKFQDTAEEGKTYFVANFMVEKNTAVYRPTTHPFKIVFSKATHIHEQTARLPKHAFSFYSLPDILKVKEREEVPQLIDAIAFVKSIGNLEEYHRDDAKKNRLRMILTNNEEAEVECVLWDECSEEAYSAYLKTKDPPVVVVLSFARIGFSEDGPAQIHNSYNATRVEFNPDIKEVKEFIARYSDGNTPVVTPLNVTFSGHFGQQTDVSTLSTAVRIPISSITDQKKGESFVVCCEIEKLETIYGWCYDGCSRCSTKVKDEDGEMFCPHCKRRPIAVEPRLKIHYIVFDHSGSQSIVFWDRDACDLVNKTAPQLKFILAEADREYDFPDELQDVVGKRFILKLRKNEFNFKYPSSSISVVQFLPCDDLMEQFDGVASGGDDDDDLPGSGRKKVSKKTAIEAKADVPGEKLMSSPESEDEPVTNIDEDDDDEDISLANFARARKSNNNKMTKSKGVEVKDKAVVVSDDDDEDVPIAKLSRASSAKGKKTSNKRSQTGASSSKTLSSPVKPYAEKRIRKTIKKEKTD